MNKWLHKLCFTPSNSRQTFNQKAHETDPLSPFYFTVCVSLSHPSLTHSSSALSINPAHSASPSILSPFPKLPISTFLSPLFLCCRLSLPAVSSVPRILTHMARFDDHSHHGHTPSTCVTSLFLNYPLISTARGAVCLKPTPILADKSLLKCYFMHLLKGLTTFDVPTEQTVFFFLLPACLSVSFGFLLLLLNSNTHAIPASSPPPYPRRRC